MNHTELIMRRRNVREFINADPINLVLSRAGEPTKTEAGGFVPTAPTERPPQTGRIVQNKRRFNNGIINSEAGDIPHTDYLLIGNYNLDAEENDTFMWQGRKYQITGIHKLRTESFLGSIDLFGPVNRNAE